MALPPSGFFFAEARGSFMEGAAAAARSIQENPNLRLHTLISHQAHCSWDPGGGAL